MVPEGVAISVITSQSMVLSGEGAKVSEMTPKKSLSPFLTFSVAPEEPSALFKGREAQCQEHPRISGWDPEESRIPPFRKVLWAGKVGAASGGN